MLMVTLGLSTIAMRRRRSTRTPDIREFAREQATKLRQQQGVREDMEQIFVQISELARELNAQMDTRFAKLEQTIATADARIASLEALLRQAAGVKGIDVLVQDDAPRKDSTSASASTSPAPVSRKSGKKAARTEKGRRQDGRPCRQDRPDRRQGRAPASRPR